jgi:rhomboid protease GluP
MVVDGADFFAPRPMDALKWGASLPLLDLSGEWWRAFTSMFLHFGIIHLALNMYALFMVSIYLEPMLGKARYISAYLCSGLMASLLSIVWHKNDLIVSAGASGAVFGMYGVFLALLTTSIIPKHVRQTMLQSILIFIAYNVFYGFKPGSGVNNVAHIGGLASGMLIGYIYYFSFKEPTPKKTLSIVSLTVVVTIMLLITIFQNEKTTPIEVDYATGEIYGLTKEVPIEHGTKGQYEQKMEEFYALEKKALTPDNDSKSTPEQLIERYKQESLPTWDEAGKIVNELKELANTTAQKKDVTILTEYIDLRKQWTYLQIKRQHDNSKELITEITDLVIKINALFESQPVSQ